MPPKSKKSAEKAKAKTIEDKTFGLKNKNRSAKVQAYVQQVTKSVRESNRDELKAKAEQEAKKKAKLEKQAFEAAMNRLVADGGDEKKKHLNQNDDSDEEEEEEQDEQDAQIQEYLWNADDFEEVEFDPGRLEEALEAEREKLKDRTDLTKITEETFRAWREKKKGERAAAEKKRLDKAKAGQGKLKGWDLWNTKKELFVDDEAGEEAYEKEFDDAALFEGGEGDEDDLEFE